jgi:hypothetical protein
MCRSAPAFWKAFALALFGWVGAQECRAEVILGPAPGNVPYQQYYFRFASGFTDDPTQTVNDVNFYSNNPTIAGIDLSGVGWRLPGIFGPGGASAWSVTMIDNIHFVGANHVAVLGDINLGDTINFRPAGTSSIVSRTVAKLQNVPNPDGSTSDVLLGTLNQPFLPTDGIASYPIAPFATNAQLQLLQQPMLVYGRQSEMGRNNTSGTQNNITFPIDGNPAHNEVLNALLYDYDQPNGNPDGRPSTVGNDEAHLNQGDSGGPSFVLGGSQLQIIGTHAATVTYEDISQTPPAGGDDTSYSLDSYMPLYSAEIAALIAVPEPSTLALGAFAITAGVAAYRRSRRRPA